MCNFPSGNFSKSVLATAFGPLQPAAPYMALPNLWEVAAWEIAHLECCHLGNCHLGSRPWENAFGKEPNTLFSPCFDPGRKVTE